MDAITSETRIVRTGRLLESEVDGEVVALDIENGQCYGLNGAGTRIWQLLQAETTPAQVCDALMAEYDVDRATCEADVAGILRTFQDEGLIELR